MLINATIQVVPLLGTPASFPVIDKAIELIQQSGIKYSVGAFETTLEGEYQAVQSLLKQVCDFCYAQTEVQFLIYTKYHICGGTDILAESKTEKFK